LFTACEEPWAEGAPRQIHYSQRAGFVSIAAVGRRPAMAEGRADTEVRP